MIARNMTECQLVEKTSEESVKMVSADLASAKNKRESRIRVLVRLDHVASFIVNANHSMM
jgi:hypothetical protein